MCVRRRGPEVRSLRLAYIPVHVCRMCETQFSSFSLLFLFSGKINKNSQINITSRRTYMHESNSNSLSIIIVEVIVEFV